MFDYKFKENESTRLFRPVAFDQGHNLFLCDDQTLAFSFLCQPVSGWDEQINSTLELMLSQDSYPIGTLLSFSLWASPDIRESISTSDRLRRECRSKLLKESQNSALGFLQSGTREPIEEIQHTKVRDFQLIITLKMPLADMEMTQDEITSVISMQRILEQRLSKAFFQPRKMTAKLLVNIMNSMLNWQDNAEWLQRRELPVDEHTTLNEQFLQYDTSVFKQRQGVVLGSKENPTFARMLTVRRFPRRTQAGAAFRWFGDPFDGMGCVTQNFLITVNINFPDSLKEKGKLETKKGHYIKQSFSALTQFAPKIKDMKADLDSITESVSNEGRVTQVTISAAVFGSTETEADDGLTSLQSYMKQAGCTMVNEDSFAIPSFIQLLPFGACAKAVRYSRRYFTMSSQHIIPILPIFAEWKGTGTPVLQFVSRTGQLMNVDLFDSKTNYNLNIYAQSGSGKSFLSNEIIRAYLSTGNKAWAIDAGESYKKLSESLGGVFTTFESNDDNVSLNPFTMIPLDDPKAFIDSLEMLGGLILAMAFWKASPTDLQQSEIERILREQWEEKHHDLLIDDIANACLREEDSRIKDIGKQIAPFTTNGQFGKYFNKPHNVEFTGDFNVLELDGLSETPRLQAVVLFMLIVQISHSMYHEYKQDRSIKRLVIVDEAWDLLSNSKAVEKFLETGFRRFRKYNGSGCIITQSVIDTQKTDAGKAISENAANTFILSQKTSAIAVAEKEDLMALPPAGYRMLRKVTTEKGHYSEIFFNTTNGMGVGRLIVDPMRSLMYSTNPADNAQIDTHIRAGLPLEEAMKQVVVEQGRQRLPLDKPEYLKETFYELESNHDAELMKCSTNGEPSAEVIPLRSVV
ncbi:type-IV secretion system protein TraC [Vibrio breoganii]|uniref:Type-IV secretion system protein TraC n=1 Tax=Vibrio breoganii TaxID=553239 RepID=A0AAP8SY91_9VIBR|nr:type IV secretion system protein TraC [Vibrio breoganii]PMK31657.1 type-IV secretion system protein TraC [Vibrio breoganii]PMK78546.1 type-IV secretion system protein TraC [Vibrio breoganii]PMP14012.1 type-IV secretion system protein TraC [Vibrio breoganii]